MPNLFSSWLHCQELTVSFRKWQQWPSKGQLVSAGRLLWTVKDCGFTLQIAQLSLEAFLLAPSHPLTAESCKLGKETGRDHSSSSIYGWLLICCWMMVSKSAANRGRHAVSRSRCLHSPDSVTHSTFIYLGQVENKGFVIFLCRYLILIFDSFLCFYFFYAGWGWNINNNITTEFKECCYVPGISLSVSTLNPRNHQMRKLTFNFWLRSR